MKIAVVSYTMTGNNGKLAEKIAAEFQAEHIKVKELKKRKMLSIVMDVVFDRTPKVQVDSKIVEWCDLIIFVGPVWLGKVATPFRKYFEYVKENIDEYAFVSINGGGEVINLKIKEDLVKRTGKNPVLLKEFHIADLLPQKLKPTRQDTMDYRVDDEDIENITNSIKKIMQNTILN